MRPTAWKDRSAARATLLVTALSLAACGVPQAPAAAPAPAAFAADIAAFEAADRRDPPAPGGVVFVGSSSIRLWPALGDDFPGVHVLQRGFGGSQLSDVVRYAPRIVLPYRPRLIVLYAGDNDLWEGKSPDSVFRDFQAFVALVGQALPETRIAYIAIKPSGSRWAIADKMRAANAMIREHTAGNPRLSYVDVFTPMLDSAGNPREDLFVSDRLHLSAKGYALWRSILLPVVQGQQRRGSAPVSELWN